MSIDLHGTDRGANVIRGGYGERLPRFSLGDQLRIRRTLMKIGQRVAPYILLGVSNSGLAVIRPVGGPRKSTQESASKVQSRSEVMGTNARG